MQFKYDQESFRIAYRYLTAAPTDRASIQKRIDSRESFCRALGCLLQDGIDSWEKVLSLVSAESEPAPASSLPDPGSIPVSTPDQLEDTVHQPAEVLLRMARDEFEHLKRAGTLAIQLLERFARENAELRERVELLEETIVASPTLKEVPELAQLLGVTDRLAEQEEKELEKVYGELPCTSPHHGNRKIVYKDHFLDTFHALDKADAKRMVKQLRTLFNKGGEYPSLQSKRLWHDDLAGTPRGSWSSKAGGGGPHALRFTWADTDSCVVVYGLYPRNDLF